MAEGQEGSKTKRAVRTYTELLRAVEAVTSLEGEQLATFGLTVSQFAVLESLLHGGPMTPTELGRRTLGAESTASKVVENLERKGMVERRAEGRDGRKVLTHLTVEGRRLAAEVYPQYAKVVRARMSVLKGGEQAKLEQLCRKLEEGDAVRFMVEMTREE